MTNRVQLRPIDQDDWLRVPFWKKPEGYFDPHAWCKPHITSYREGISFHGKSGHLFFGVRWSGTYYDGSRVRIGKFFRALGLVRWLLPQEKYGNPA